MSEYYNITIAGVNRDLPICPIDDHLDIAGFVMFGDVEITVASAKELLKVCPKHDVIVTAETKGIPLAYEMAKMGNTDYVVARKGIKAYMMNPIMVEVKSITTGSVQKLYFSEADCDKLRGKKVLIVDDVISTGESLAALERLLAQIGDVEIVGKAAVLAEGVATERDDIVYLESLPLFFK